MYFEQQPYAFVYENTSLAKHQNYIRSFMWVTLNLVDHSLFAVFTFPDFWDKN